MVCPNCGKAVLDRSAEYEGSGVTYSACVAEFVVNDAGELITEQGQVAAQAKPHNRKAISVREARAALIQKAVPPAKSIYLDRKLIDSAAMLQASNHTPPASQPPSTSDGLCTPW